VRGTTQQQTTRTHKHMSENITSLLPVELQRTLKVTYSLNTIKVTGSRNALRKVTRNLARELLTSIEDHCAFELKVVCVDNTETFVKSWECSGNHEARPGYNPYARLSVVRR